MAQADFELVITLPQPTERWDYRHAPAHQNETCSPSQESPAGEYWISLVYLSGVYIFSLPLTLFSFTFSFISLLIFEEIMRSIFHSTSHVELARECVSLLSPTRFEAFSKCPEVGQGKSLFSRWSTTTACCHPRHATLWAHWRRKIQVPGSETVPFISYLKDHRTCNLPGPHCPQPSAEW